MRLDGFDDYVECGTNNRGITSTITAEAWVKTSSWVYHWVVGKYDREAQGGYHLIIKDGKAAFAGRDGSGTYKISGYSSVLVNDNQWHHLAGVCNNGTWQIYVDGVLQNQLVSGYNTTDLTSTAMMAIGKDFLANNENYNGQVDEIRVWKRALSQAEIRQSMCQKVLPTANDLVAYFDLNEGAGSSIQDLSLLKINGTFRNMNAATAWIVSGAPVGDKSVYLYPSTWVAQQLDLSSASSNKLSVTSASSGLQGMHIYTVSTPPNSKIGLENSEQVIDYFGVFKIGSQTSEYKIVGNQNNTGCSRSLYIRPDNTIPSWLKQDEKTLPELPELNTNAVQREIALTALATATTRIQGKTIICKGSSTTLQITTTGTILWTTGETTSSIKVSTPGQYGVTVKIGSCEFTDKVTVTEEAIPIFNLGDNTFICPGEKITLSAPANMASYRWSTGATTPTIEVSTTGTYWVEVANESGCTSSDEIKISVKPTPSITLLKELSVCYGETVTLNAATQDATSYHWSNGQTSESITVTAPAEVSVTITVDGCDYVRQVNVLSDECPIIPNIITPNRDGKNDTFVLKGINIDAMEIEIFNRWGKSIYKRPKYDNMWAADGANAGIYYYRIKSRQTQKEYKGWVEVVK